MVNKGQAAWFGLAWLPVVCEKLIDFATTEINFVICCIFIHAVHVVVQFYPWFEYFVCLVCV